MNDVLNFITKKPLPEGQEFSGSYGLWIVNQEYTKLSFFAKNFQDDYSIKGLGLDPKEDHIKNISWILIKKKILIFLENQGEFRVILYDIRFNDFFRDSKRKITLKLKGVFFHQHIHMVFVPFQGSFCIISQEGISIHTSKLVHAYFLGMTITRCLFDRDIAVLMNGNDITIHQFSDSAKDVQLVRFPTNDPKSLRHLVAGKTFIFLIYVQSQHVLVQAIPYVTNVEISNYTPSIVNVSNYLDGEKEFSISTYDDALLLSSGINNTTVLVDVSTKNVIKIGEPMPIYGKCIDSDIFINNNEMYTIEPNYDVVNDNSIDTICSLYKRKDGDRKAINIVYNMIEHVSSIKEMDDIIYSVGPLTVTPEQQLRFTKAILFSKNTNIHLILIALLHYSQLPIENPNIIPEVSAPLHSLLYHENIKYSTNDLLYCWGMKTNKDLTKLLIEKETEDFHLSQSNAESILELAECYLEEENPKESKKLILKAMLDGENKEKLSELISKFANQFGADELGEDIVKKYLS